MTRGIYYIATGKKYIREAKLSAQSVSDEMPNAEMAIATDQRPESNIFDEVILLNSVDHTFADQINNLNKSPFKKTLYIDSDIYFDGDVNDVFELLDRFDIALAQNPARESWNVDGVPDSFPEYNSGVIAYRTSAIKKLEQEWLSEYKRQFEKTGYYQNQPSLRKVLYESDLRIATLPPEYNCITWMPGQVSGKVKMFHGRLIDMESTGPNSEDIDDAIQIINSSNETRTFTQLGGISIHSNGAESIFNRFRMSLRRHGIKTTFSRLKNKF